MSARVDPDAREAGPVSGREEPFEGAAELFHAADPFLKFGAKMQSECLQLYARRLSAYLEIPDRLSCCESPADLLSQQREFFATMQQDYAAAVQTLARLHPLDVVPPAQSEHAAGERPPESETSATDPTQKPTERKLSRRAA